MLSIDSSKHPTSCMSQMFQTGAMQALTGKPVHPAYLWLGQP